MPLRVCVCVCVCVCVYTILKIRGVICFSFEQKDFVILGTFLESLIKHFYNSGQTLKIGLSMVFLSQQRTHSSGDETEHANTQGGSFSSGQIS